MDFSKRPSAYVLELSNILLNKTQMFTHTTSETFPLFGKQEFFSFMNQPEIKGDFCKKQVILISFWLDSEGTRWPPGSGLRNMEDQFLLHRANCPGRPGGGSHTEVAPRFRE